MSRKRGKFSLEERSFIERNVLEMPVAEMASHLNRTEDTIERFIRENELRGRTQEFEDAEKVLISKLRHRPYYKDVALQLTANELGAFESGWISLVLQFREDVQYSEELSIKQLLILDILLDRSMIERKRFQEDADRIQRRLDIEFEKPEEERDVTHMINLEQQVSYARSAITSYTTEHAKLLGERKFVEKSLKATREERVKRSEDGQSSFVGLLRALEDEKERKKMGEYAELMRLAKEEARKRMSEYHTYVDGKIDRPLLNTDTVEKNG
jgi:hypothetical protein